MKKILQGLRYGVPASQQYLSKGGAAKYDTLFVNSKTFMQSANSVSMLAIENSNRGKELIIDPQTYSFQRSLEFLFGKPNKKTGAQTIKKTFLKLIDIYGGPFKKAVIDQKRPIESGDFNERDIKGLSDVVMDFQREAIINQTTISKSKKYFMFLQKKKMIDLGEARPSALIPPYFYLDGIDDGWLDLNLRFITAALKQLKSREELYPQVVISQSLLTNRSAVTEMVASYARVLTNRTKICIWVDEFDESVVKQSVIRDYLYLLEKFNNLGDVYVLYGGYFTILALSIISNRGGVAHGLEYGESRKVYPVSGGVPSSKYYFPKFHKRYEVLEVIEICRKLKWLETKSIFNKNVCNCQTCLQQIGVDVKGSLAKYANTAPAKSGSGRLVPTAKTRHVCLEHYLNVKNEEYNKALNIVGELKNISNASIEFDEVMGLLDTKHNHLNAWLIELKKKYDCS